MCAPRTHHHVRADQHRYGFSRRTGLREARKLGGALPPTVTATTDFRAPDILVSAVARSPHVGALSTVPCRPSCGGPPSWEGRRLSTVIAGAPTSEECKVCILRSDTARARITSQTFLFPGRFRLPPRYHRQRSRITETRQLVKRLNRFTTAPASRRGQATDTLKFLESFGGTASRHRVTIASRRAHRVITTTVRRPDGQAAYTLGAAGERFCFILAETKRLPPAQLHFVSISPETKRSPASFSNTG